MLDAGMILNDTYRIEKQIGSGGGGIIYKAYHKRLRTYVVVKQIKEHVKGILEGRAEADILKNIKHSRLPRVYDFLEIDGEIYTVMDFIPGKSLLEALKEEGRFDPKEVFQWTLQLADALRYLHEQIPPIIHSDIKPANIMLLPDRSITLIDFNVSLVFDKERQTTVGVSCGYSPPEQYRNYENFYWDLGKSGMSECETTEIDPMATVLLEHDTESLQTIETKKIVRKGIDERSDIYSLGTTVYHLLTGIKPSKNFEEIIPILQYEIALGEGFKVIINKMMELEPEKRYQNGGELLYALKHIKELDSEYQKYQKKKKTRKILTAGLYGMGIILLGLGGITVQQENIIAYNEYIQESEELIEKMSFMEAKEKIDVAQELLPKKVDAYEKEMLLLYSMGDYEETIRYGRRLVNNPVYRIIEDGEKELYGNILYILGNAYFEQEDYASAIICFSNAIEYNQKNSFYYRDYAFSMAKQGNIEEAELILKKAMELKLGEDSLYLIQGEIAFMEGNYEEAIKYFEKSIKFSSDKEIIYRGSLLEIEVYEKLGEDYIDCEIEILERAKNRLGIENSMHISQKLAEVYGKKAKKTENSNEWYVKALIEFQILYESGYATRQTMENMAVIYEQMHQLKDAEEILLQVIEKYPEDYRAYKRMAFLEADKQQKKTNRERSYWKMKEYYAIATKKYKETEQDNDSEMKMLENMIQDLETGGWF